MEPTWTGDFLRHPETSFMDTVNKFLLLYKPKYKQMHQEWTFTILYTLLTCQLQHFTLDWEAIKTITSSLTRAFKTCFETILARKCVLIGILTQRVAWIWTIFNSKALCSNSAFLWFLRTPPKVGRCNSSFTNTSTLCAWTSGRIMLVCFCFRVFTFQPFREITNLQNKCTFFFIWEDPKTQFSKIFCLSL